MPNVQVECSVSNCFFHKKGNLCGAEKIMIETDSNNKEEFASDFDYEKEKATHSQHTCCKTFRPKKE